MSNTSSTKQMHELLFPYRGPWNVPWVIQRYLRSALAGFSVRKSLNASRALFEMYKGKTCVKSRPFVTRVEACNICQLKCPLCACGTNQDPRPKGRIDVNHYIKVLEDNRNNSMILRLDGMGEPTLHPDFFELVRIAKSFKQSVSVHTNFCTPLSSDASSFIDCGIDRIVVSLDGATEESYQKYRIGAELKVVVENLKRLSREKKKSKSARPIIEAQFILFDHNKHEINQVRELALEAGCDKFEVSAPDFAAKTTKLNPNKPRRCFWLWTTLVVGWNLDYRPCNNAWSIEWPRLNYRETPVDEYWNHELMIEARQYNNNKQSQIIADDPNCKCNRCFEMQVVPLDGDYTCE
jgi:wyosine [tRNA(Phe)-imidazoG37] synthetase (radical SAM superfamily)